MTNYNERLDEILDGRVCPTCFSVVEIIDETIIFDETIKSETLKQPLKCENESCPTLYRVKRFGNDWYIDKSTSKQAITSLFKELVAEAEPGTWVDPEDTDDLEWWGYVSGVNDFEQNLLKALENGNE